MIGSYLAWRQRKKAIHDGRLLEREAKRGLRRHADSLSATERSKIQGAVTRFEGATKDGDKDAVEGAVAELDKVLDEHLSFARKSTLREYVEAIGTAVLIALFLRAFVVEAFKIPSGSMIPTLQVGDHIFVNKFIYGVRVPWTDLKIGTSVRRPRRGEVIVFIYPKDRDVEEKDFIKRIVAVEGDTVQMRDGVLYVNNEAVPHREIAGDCMYDDYIEQSDVWDKRPCEVVKETVNGVEYTTYHAPGLDGVGPPHNTSPYVVPPDSVFVEGDNRDNSNDSRWWGPVPDNLIKGKAMVIWWSQGNPDASPTDSPLSFLRSIPIVKFLYGGRYERMFKLVR